MSVWVPVLPSLKGFAKAVEGEARSAAKRGGAASADEFGKAGTNAGKALADGLAKQSKTVESASKRLASARDVEATASGKVKIAELELEGLRRKGTASASQIARAEEGLADAKRKAETASERLQRADSDLKTAREGGETAARALVNAEDRLVNAKNAQETAAGKVRVSELRVNEMREAAAAKADAVTSAEDRLALARETGDADGVARAERELEKARGSSEAAALRVAGAETTLAKGKATLESANDSVASAALSAKAVHEDVAATEKQLGKEAAEAAREVDGLGDSMGDADEKGRGFGGTLMDGIRNIGKGALLGVGAQIGSTVTSGFGTAISAGMDRLQAVEQAETMLQGLGNSAEDAAAIMDNAMNSVKGTAFGFGDAAGLAATLVASGIEPGEELERVLTLVGDSAAITGSDLGEMGSIWAKVAANGKMSTGEMNQLLDRSLGLLPALSEHLGVSAEEARKMVTEGAVDFETFSDVMENMVGGSAQAMGSTFSGSFDNMKAALGRFGAKLLEPVFTSAPAIFDAVGGAMDGLGEKLGPVIEDFGAKLQPVMEDFAQRLGPIVQGAFDLIGSAAKAVADAIAGVFGWMKDNQTTVTIISGALVGLAGAYGAVRLQMALVAAQQKIMAAGGMVSFIKGVITSTKLWAGAQAALNFVMNMNPMMKIVTVAMIAVGALTAFFTKTETGKKIWQGFVDVLSGVWDWISTTFGPVFEWLGGVIGDVWQGILDGWDLLWGGIQTAWESVLKPTFEFLFDVAMNTIGVIATLILAPLLLAWEALSAGISWAWETLIKPAWDAMSGAITWLWESVLQPVFGWIKAGWELLAGGIMFYWQNVIQPAWNAVSTTAQWLWNSVLSPVFGWIRSGWELLSAGISAVWNNIIRPVWDAFGSVISWVVDNVVEPAFEAVKTALGKVGDFFETVVDGIKTVWNGLKSILAKPINFMIGTVYNKGIRKAWNMIARFLPIDEASEVAEIPEHATGGAIRGPGTGTSDDVLMWGSNGEHMLTAAEVRALGGQGNVYTLRHMIDQGKAFSYDGKGGVIALPNLPGNVVGDLAGAAPGLFPAFARGGEVTRPAWEAQLERGHRFAQSIAPGPYILGGSSSQGSTDCSGYMSEIADVILGGPGGTRKWATMSFPGPQAGAWAPGLGKGFSVGIVNGGPAGGHTAGTLSAAGPFSAVNVESGGGTGQGATYGGAAVGADHPQFPDKYHLKIGADGAFESAGGPSPEQKRSTLRDKVKNIFDDLLGPVDGALDAAVGTPPPEFFGIPRKSMKGSRDEAVDFLFDLVGKLGDLLGSVYDKAKDVGGAVLDAGSAVWDNTLGRLFDTGGMLESGGVAVNKSGKPERVLSPSQTVAFETFMTALPSMFAGAGSSDELAAAIGEETAKALSDTLASVPGAVGDSALDFFGMKGTWFTDPAVLEVSWDAAKDATEDAGGATDVALDAADSAADAADSSADAADAAADTAETVAGMSDPADEDAEDAPAPSTADAAPVADTAAPATGAGDVAAATGTGGTERVNLDRGMVQNLVMENVTTVDPLEVAREVSRMARVAMAGII